MTFYYIWFFWFYFMCVHLVWILAPTFVPRILLTHPSVSILFYFFLSSFLSFLLYVNSFYELQITSPWGGNKFSSTHSEWCFTWNKKGVYGWSVTKKHSRKGIGGWKQSKEKEARREEKGKAWKAREAAFSWFGWQEETQERQGEKETRLRLICS